MSNRTAADEMEGNASRSEALILVHGTFAADPSAHGSGWWQIGSEFWGFVQAKFGSLAPGTQQNDVFHWSGENLESERRSAARDLVAILEKYELDKKPYHLIGHSHGGSVIWFALRQMVRRRRSLRCLRSWATVGTPFYVYETQAFAWILVPMAFSAFALWSMLPLATEFWRNMTEIIPPHGGWTFVFMVLGVLWYVFLVNLLLLLVKIITGQVLTRNRAETPPPKSRLYEYAWLGPTIIIPILIGIVTYLASDQWTGFENFFEASVTLMPFLLCGLMWILLVITFLSLVSRFIRNLVSRILDGVERVVATQTFEIVGDRYLGIWSKHDEAINGLRATLAPPVAVVPRAAPASKSWGRFFAGYLSESFRWFYNIVFARASDEFIWDRLTKRLQGNDYPRYEVAEVRSHPASSNSSPGLSEALEVELSSRADAYAAALAPTARRLLGLAATAGQYRGGLVALLRENPTEGALIWNGVVHTSYFAIPGVVALLTGHIARTRQLPSHDGGEASGPPRHGFTRGLLRSAHRERRLVWLRQAAAFGSMLGVVALWLGTEALFSRNVYPNTDQYQFEQAVANAKLLLAATTYLDNPAPNYVAALVRAGFPVNARSAIHEIKNKAVRAFCLAALAEALVGRGDVKRATEAMTDALSAAPQAQSNVRMEVFTHFAAAAKAFVVNGQAEAVRPLLVRAEGLITTVPTANNRINVLLRLAEVRIAMKDEPGARALLIRAVEAMGQDRSAGLEPWAAKLMMQIGMRSEAETLLDGAPERVRISRDRDPFHMQLGTIAYIGLAWFEFGVSDKATALMNEALQGALALQEYKRPETISQISRIITDGGQFALVLAAASVESDPRAKAEMLGNVLRSLSMAQNSSKPERQLFTALVDDALRAIAQIGNNYVRALALAEIGTALARVGQLDKAKRVIGSARLAAQHVQEGDREVGDSTVTVTDDDAATKKAEALVSVSRAYRLSGDPAEALATLEDAVRAASEVQGDSSVSWVLTPIAEEFIRNGAYRKGRTLCEACSSEDRVKVYTRIVERWIADTRLKDK